MEQPVKQVIVIRRDLGMRRGKEIAQGAHASMAWLTRRLEHRYPNDFTARLSEAEQAWVTGAFRKITCQVSSEEEILALKRRATDAGVQAYVITDAGLTEFGGEETVTAIAIGPDWDENVDKVTGELKLY
jgi:PTH2 family peptidyl-tRNA hydrolase